MDLKEYLDAYFYRGSTGVFEKLPVDLITHFLEKFGVDVKNEGNLYQFKYNMISAKWSMPLTHECRGVILRHNDNGNWDYVARPYNKFFNFHEPLCVIRESDFSPNLQIIEKADGTCIQMWFDDVQEKWRFSTLGTITTMSYDQAFRPNDTFADLFIRTAKNINYDRFDKQFTYIFELCTHDNRIVTQYAEDSIYLIAAREKRYGNYLTAQLVDDLCLNLMLDGMNVKRPELTFFSQHDFKTFKDVANWVEDQADPSKLWYGEYPEGFVIYRGGIPVAKMKNAKYLAAFHVSGGNKGHAKNAIIEAIFVGNIDDVYSMMIPELQKFADDIKEKVRALGVEVLEASKWIAKENCDTQKDFALAVQKHLPNKLLHSFFYQNREAVLKGENLNGLYTEWIKTYYMRFLQLWKCIEEKG